MNWFKKLVAFTMAAAVTMVCVPTAVHAAESVVDVTINSDGTCSGGTEGYSACAVSASTGNTSITFNGGYTLRINNPEGKNVEALILNSTYTESRTNAKHVYYVAGSYSGGDGDDPDAFTFVYNYSQTNYTGNITGGTYAGLVMNLGVISDGIYKAAVDNYRTINGGIFYKKVENIYYGFSPAHINFGTFYGTVNNSGAISYDDTTTQTGTLLFYGYVDETYKYSSISANYTHFINGITGNDALTLSAGYADTEQAFTSMYGELLDIVCDDDTVSDKFDWDDENNNLKIAAGLPKGTYHVTITTTNGYNKDGTPLSEEKAFVFTVTVNDTAQPASPEPASPSPEPSPEPTPPEPVTKNVYRLYNGHSGEHFYTTSAYERDYIMTAGWSYEGVAWMAPESGTPVIRMYNPVAGEHHYTTSQEEAAALEEAEWNLESDCAFYSADAVTGKAVYRLYNPNAYANNHHFTPSEEEAAFLTEAGWILEGTAWYSAE